MVAGEETNPRIFIAERAMERNEYVFANETAIKTRGYLK